MNNIKKPKTPEFYHKFWKAEDVYGDQEKLDLWKKQAEEYNTLANEHRFLLETEFKKIVDAAKNIWPSSTCKERKYIEKMALPFSPKMSYDRMVTDKLVEYERTQQAKKHLQESQDRKKARTEKAIVWLLDRGKKMSVDFNIDNATDVADEIAADEYIAQEIENGDVDIDQCDDCSSWDGSSNRCSCGNVRLYWDRDQATFESPYCYPAKH